MTGTQKVSNVKNQVMSMLYGDKHQKKKVNELIMVAFERNSVECCSTRLWKGMRFPFILRRGVFESVHVLLPSK